MDIPTYLNENVNESGILVLIENNYLHFEKPIPMGSNYNQTTYFNIIIFVAHALNSATAYSYPYLIAERNWIANNTTCD